MLWGANISSQQLSSWPGICTPQNHHTQTLQHRGWDCSGPGRRVQQLELEHISHSSWTWNRVHFPHAKFLIKDYMKYSPSSLLPALCTHPVSAGKGSCHIFPCVFSSSSSSLHCTPWQGQGTHQHTLNPSAQNPGEDPQSAGSQQCTLSEAQAPYCYESTNYSIFFSSLLIFILPLLVMGTSCRRNCKCSAFLVCEKLNDSLPQCHGHIWDTPGTNTGSCTTVHVLGAANNQKNSYWFLFWRSTHDKSEINTELRWCFSVAPLSNERIADTQDPSVITYY